MKKATTKKPEAKLKASAAPVLTRYAKWLTIDEDSHLCSAHGGRQAWRLDPATMTGKDFVRMEGGKLCQNGTLHACRLRDLPAWISTHLVIVETDTPTDKIIVGDDKIGCKSLRIVRLSLAWGLDEIVAIANYAAELAAQVAKGGKLDTNALISSRIVELVEAKEPGFFDGVEK